MGERREGDARVALKLYGSWVEKGGKGGCRSGDCEGVWEVGRQ